MDSKNLSQNDAAFVWRNLWVQHPMCAAEDDWNVRGGVDLGHGGGNDLKEEWCNMELHEVQALG